MEHPQNTLVSVIVPVYNKGEYLTETVQSILRSTYQHIEVILIDDGSSDNSVEIAKDFAGQNSKVKFLQQENQGVSVARNNAIENALGIYILPFDADDILMPEFIGEAVKVLNANSNIKVVSSRGEFTGNKTGEWILPTFDLKILATKNMLPACCMYRKEDWKRVGGYFAGLKGREDWDFWISLLKEGGEVYRLPIIGFKYRIQRNSKRIRTRKYKKEFVDIFNARHKEFFKKYLNGPLRYQRSWSKRYNNFLKLLGLLK